MKKERKEKHHSDKEIKAKKKKKAVKERMRRRQDARTGETDTIAVNIQKGTAELKKKRVDAEVEEQRAADAPAGVINTKHRQQRKSESKKGQKRWQKL